MKRLLKEIFTWWNGNTINTRFFTWRHGTPVGKDQFNNIYYEGSCDREGNQRRWVIYKNYSDSSQIPPDWHGWIHYRINIPPSYKSKNTTSINKKITRLVQTEKDSSKKDNYDAWIPE
ncbi:MAG: hypothetical protein JSC161_000262 [Candidatus Tokpelaia sp. JSC161]|jgi:NADH:ubiquinone oxidoreductase subunit|nr:MAG: hypothetical protein JSC161_000262 [Candidatus Tokpelaia sp. JSC161]